MNQVDYELKQIEEMVILVQEEIDAMPKNRLRMPKGQVPKENKPRMSHDSGKTDAASVTIGKCQDYRPHVQSHTAYTDKPNSLESK